MKILYVATYYVDDYVRQTVIRKALKKSQSNEIVECVVNKKSVLRYLQFIWRFIKIPKNDIDIIIVGFRSHEILPFIKLFSNKPIIFDAFISLYDTLCFDRKKFLPHSIIGRLLKWYDTYLCKISTKIILDTNEHIDFFVDTFNIPKEKFFRIFVGADEDKFYPRVCKKNNKFTVFYYGTGLPLQGIDIILKAAKKLENTQDINFLIIGPIRKKFKNLINSLRLNNITIKDWVPYEQLANEIARADICLGGHFSNIAKAKRVISGKTFQFLAMQKPTIVGANKANEELLSNNINTIFCSHDNPKELSETILELKNNKILQNRLSKNGYDNFINKASIRILGQELTKLISTIENNKQ